MRGHAAKGVLHEPHALGFQPGAEYYNETSVPPESLQAIERSL